MYTSPSPEFLKLTHSKHVKILLNTLISRAQPGTELWGLGTVICMANEPPK